MRNFAIALSGEIRHVPHVGQGMYDNFVELYEVSCGERAVQVHMDRSDDLPADTEPVPGFALACDAQQPMK
jgi:hypothetical protein